MVTIISFKLRQAAQSGNASVVFIIHDFSVFMQRPICSYNLACTSCLTHLFMLYHGFEICFSGQFICTYLKKTKK